MNAKYLKNDPKWDLGVYKSTIGHSSASVVSAIDRFEKSVENIKREISESNPNGEIISEVELEDDLGTAFATLMDDLQNEVFYNSLLVIAISFFEFSLIELCRVSEPYLVAGKERFSDYSGMGIQKSKKFLRGSWGIEIPKIKNWENILKYAEVRNCIVHNSSNVFEDYSRGIEEQECYKLFGSINTLTITETGYIFIKDIECIRGVHSMTTNFIAETTSLFKERLLGKA
jgi:hypothetical protein